MGLLTAAWLLGTSSGCGESCGSHCEPWSFTDVAASTGINLQHEIDLLGLGDLTSQTLAFSGGVAAADYDGDGRIDLYAVGGAVRGNHLYRNLGSRFVDVTQSAGVGRLGLDSSGAVFVDYNGDGLVDLWVGGIAGSSPSLFRNRGDGSFEDRFEASGIAAAEQNLGAAFADVDSDGDLDAVFAHWGSRSPQSAPLPHLWYNNGDETFTASNSQSGLSFNPAVDWLFSPRFTDLDGDRRLDLLAVGDFASTRAFLGNGDGTFTEFDRALFTDENGMGTATGDFDGDGDIDWFVTSIFGPPPMGNGNWGTSGNRLYRNDINQPQSGGTTAFADATDLAGLRVGHWGWGTCAADFDLDGDLDIYQVNGMDFGPGSASTPFNANPALFYVNNGQGIFTEHAAQAGLDHDGQGRGVSCFDYDRDGDIDIAVSNTNGPLQLFRNDSRRSGSWLTVRLQGIAANSAGLGARLELIAPEGSIQVREIHGGGGFVSHDPPEAHFAIPTTPQPDDYRLVVRWPDGTAHEFTEIKPGSSLTLSQASMSATYSTEASACCNAGGIQGQVIGGGIR